MQEQGVPNYDLPSFSGVVGPKGIPDAIADRMHAAINAALARPALRESFERSGTIAYPSTRAEFLAAMQEQRAIWQELVRVSGVQPEG